MKKQLFPFQEVLWEFPIQFSYAVEEDLVFGAQLGKHGPVGLHSAKRQKEVLTSKRGEDLGELGRKK